MPGIEICSSLKQVIRDKINEEIGHCSQGFHNRINSLYGLFFVPKTVSELLQRVRQSILVMIVTKDTDDVHRQNYISRRAFEIGYGVECTNAQDTFVSNNGYLGTSPTIVLDRGFEEEFHWPNIIKKLNEEIKSVLISSFGYRGNLEGNEEAYDKGDYDSFKLYIGELFNKQFTDEEFLVFDEDYLNVIDVNWQLISKELWDNIKKDIFNFPLEVSDAITSLFSLEGSEENAKETVNRAFSQVRGCIDNINDFHIFISLFLQISQIQKN